MVDSANKSSDVEGALVSERFILCIDGQIATDTCAQYHYKFYKLLESLATSLRNFTLCSNVAVSPP